TGLVGLRPRDDDTLEVDPLAPPDWPYFALEDVWYHGWPLSIFWDRDGTRYKLGKGLHVFYHGEKIASSERLGELTGKSPDKGLAAIPWGRFVNYAVNNDGTYFPRIIASYTAPGTSTAKLIDGNYWYHVSPPNRWTCEGSPNATDWLMLDFGTRRRING